MDEQIKQLFKALLKLHIDLAAHVEAQDDLLEYLTKQVVSRGGDEFDLDAHRVEITQLMEDKLKRYPTSDEQLERCLSGLYQTPPPDVPPQTPPETPGSTPRE